ncbi:uncharacterized protein N0V96_009536 [Colletotrichum fioriniae]|uniref:uncharacterized protein n=1 Tax=Colletotrichum fioriniae TaxID=710243 RepID=UPI0032DBBD02|nr:hypothetical protein N0V96_009536 [Colletotrichum fioriniae]
MALMGRAGFSLPSGQFTTFNELKTSLYQRRTLFLGEAQGPQLSMFEEFPPRLTTDFLIRQYFDTFGSVFALLQKPIFQDQVLRFWEKPESVPISDCIQILLVIAIGNGTLDTSSGRLPDTKIEGWWHLILAWQGVALRSNPCDVSTLQACCLIDIMRQVYSLDSTATWSSSGMLARNAMVAGLHRDPSITGDRLTKDELEIQQNLWYTILELDLQSSMNEGILTTIGPDDWDMSLPAPPKPNGIGEGSFLGASSPVGYLISTLRTRMRIANFLNDIRCSMKYEEASKLQETFEAVAPSITDHKPWTLIAELRDRIIDIVDRYALIAERRLATQDFVGKAFIIANMVSAKAKLVRMGHSGAEIDAASPAMAKDIAEVCFAIFRNRPDIPGPVQEDMTPMSLME